MDRMQHRCFSKTCKLIFMLSLTMLFFVVEIISGFLTRSVALVADSAHMLSDSGALLIALFSVRISKRKSSKNTYGWVRAEILGALVNAVFLLALCVSISIQAIKRWCHWIADQHNRTSCSSSAESCFISKNDTSNHRSCNSHDECTFHCNDDTAYNPICENTLICVRDSDDGTLTDNRRISKDSAGQMNMRGVILHVFNDALGSVVVIISGLCIRYIPDRYTWKHYFDPIMSLMMVTLIVSFTAPLLKESVMILLQTVPTHIHVDQLQEKLLATVNGVVDIHDLQIWQLCGMKIIASAHVQCHNLNEYMKVAEDIKYFFHKEGIHSTTIQPEFCDEYYDGSASCIANQ
ncbi:hypothetical protein GJ496_011709 [Pomphorhynchus laevis]|nr:hypothetical protein GJ496_011709 [Pomphorhynchus laevis]